MRRLFIALGFVALAAARDAHAQAYKVIVNEANATSGESAAEVAQLFMKKKTTWTGGTPVVPVDLTAESATRAAFSKEVLGKDVAAMKLYWQQQMFAGRGTAPDEKASDAAVIAFVKENPGAIGYVSGAAATAGVKVLTVK